MILITIFCLLLYLVAAIYDLKERQVPKWVWLLVFIIACAGLIIEPPYKTQDLILSVSAALVMAVYLWFIKSGKADVKAIFLLGLIYPMLLLPLIICFLAFLLSIIFGLTLKTWKSNIPFIVPLLISMVIVILLLMFV